jgi:WD40 repeat protein
MCLEKDVVRKIILSGSWDKTVRIWNAEEFTCINIINIFSESLSSIVLLNRQFMLGQMKF